VQVPGLWLEVCAGLDEDGADSDELSQAMLLTGDGCAEGGIDIGGIDTSTVAPAGSVRNAADGDQSPTPSADEAAARKT